MDNLGEDFSNSQDQDQGNDDLGGEGEDEYEPDAAGDDTADVFAMEDGDGEGDDDDDDQNVFRLPTDDTRRGGRQQLDDMRQPRVTHTPRGKAKGDVKPDGKGNLVNAKGEIVARGGVQSRFYNNMRKAQRESAGYATQLQDTQGRLQKAVQIGRQLNDKVKSYEAMDQRMKQFNLEPEDQLHALQIYADLRKAPEATMKRLLTKLASQGINVTGMQPGGVDSKSLLDEVKSLVSKEMEPLRQAREASTQRQQEQQQRDAGLQQVREEVSNFFDRRPEARRFLPVFRRVMQDPRYANWSLGEVYLEIMRNNRSKTSTGPSRRQPTPQRGSMPNGRSQPPNGGTGDQLYSVDTSWDKIIGESLDNGGYRRAV